MLKARFLENSWGKKKKEFSLILNPTVTVVLHKIVSFIKSLQQVLTFYLLPPF